LNKYQKNKKTCNNLYRSFHDAITYEIVLKSCYKKMFSLRVICRQQRQCIYDQSENFTGTILNSNLNNKTTRFPKSSDSLNLFLSQK
jgi:hypothetical protein